MLSSAGVPWKKKHDCGGNLLWTVGGFQPKEKMIMDAKGNNSGLGL